MTANGSSNQQQIIQNVLDVVKQALRVTLNGEAINVTLEDPLPVSFSGGTQHVEIDSLSDSVAIADAITGNSAEVINRKLQVDATGTFTGTTTIPPSTDYQPKTVTVTTTPQQLTFPALTQVTAITIVALGANTDSTLIAKTSGASASNSYALLPGTAVTLPVSSGAAVWLIASSGSQVITALAVN